MSRIESVVACDQERYLLQRCVALAEAGLPYMFRSDRRAFAFTRKRSRLGDLELMGDSLRYGAIVALGAQCLPVERQTRIFEGETALDFCQRLIGAIGPETNLGDLALVAWAALELEAPDKSRVVDLLNEAASRRRKCFTVEAAWLLSAGSAAARAGLGSVDLHEASEHLMQCFQTEAGLFPHWTDAASAPRHRRHAACFADQVYPIQALARAYQVCGDQSLLDAAAKCASTICRLQGDAGQWWWHYDVRTGDVLEGYPVYTVHQDSMAPMALLDLLEAGGPDCTDAIRSGLAWMENAVEVGECLVDEENALIWRSVRRKDPAKFVRKVRAVVAGPAPDVRLRWIDALFPPVTIDYEDRPYHLGWILYAWLGGLKQS